MTVDSDLLMELADCGSPEKLLSVIFAHRAEWTPPVPLEAFAASVGIEEIKGLAPEGFEGALVTDANKTRGAILYNARSLRQRRWFTIGHELGHFLIPTHRGNQQCTSKDMREVRRTTDRERREAEANRFSAGLLMPKPWFEREMGKLGSADVTHVRKLAEIFDTSLEATANRYADLTDDCCAFVLSKDGAIRYARPTHDFPRLAVRRGDRLPNGARATAAVHGASDWRELEGSIWLAEKPHGRQPTILEQMISQAGGYQLTLLYIEPSDADEEDDELEESWQPRFRR